MKKQFLGLFIVVAVVFAVSAWAQGGRTGQSLEPQMSAPTPQVGHILMPETSKEKPAGQAHTTYVLHSLNGVNPTVLAAPVPLGPVSPMAGTVEEAETPQSLGCLYVKLEDVRMNLQAKRHALALLLLRNLDSRRKRKMQYTGRRVGLSGIVVLLTSVWALPQTNPSIPGLPGALNWQNTPRSWHAEAGNVLKISAGAKTDWFVDPFDGTVARNAPILLFTPDPDYVLSTRVALSFVTKWDAGALMLWGDDHHWAKLSFELSPEKKPTLVTVVTRGLSDDCNSKEVQGDSVYLRIAKTGTTYVFYFSTDARHWQILRTFSLDTELPVRVGFEAQSPAGAGTVVKFSSINYEPHRIGNIYK